MESTIIKYLSILLLCISGIIFTPEIQAQHANIDKTKVESSDSLLNKKNTENILNDSIKIKETIEENNDLQKIQSLESPVDTAKLSLKSDSIINGEGKLKKRWIPDSNKSVWMAMVLPGAGQIYNRKYWKLPIIYGGFVGCAYALTWNTKMYNDYSQAYQDIMSDNPNNDSYKDFIPSYVDIESNLEYYQETFKNAKDIYRRQRDLSIFAFIGVYLLSVIDAYVDAELSDFDISKDLSMKIEPKLFNDVFRKSPQGIGLQCSITF